MFEAILKSVFGLGAGRATRRRARRRPESVAAIESLETRILPAGNVLATIAGDTVVLSGDSAANDVTLLGTDAGVILRGANGTTVNGSPDDAVLFAGQTTVNGSVVAYLGQGDDILRIDGVDVGRELIVYGESGHDGLFLESTTIQLNLIAVQGSGDDLISAHNSRVKGNVVAMGSAGFDVLHFDHVEIGRDLIFQGGKGSDHLGVTSTTVGGNLVFIGERGHDALFIQGSTLNRNAVADLGSGDNLLAIQDSTVTGDVVATGTKGNDRLAVDASNIGRSVVGNLGRGRNDVRISGTGIDHNVILIGGRETDVVKIENSAIVHGLVMDLGREDDSVLITGASTVGQSIIINGGTGTDSVQIDPGVSQPASRRIASVESNAVNPALLASRIDDPQTGLTAAVLRSRRLFLGQPSFTVDLSGNSPIASNGAVIVFEETLNIAVTGTPGLTVQLDRDGDGAFDDGSVTLDDSGMGVIQTQLIHNDANRGLNRLAVRALENGVPIASPQEINVHFVIGTVVRFDTELGSYDVELLDDDAPMTVENFLNYSGRYEGTILHRSARTQTGGDFVIQGGGFDLVPPLTPVQTDPAIPNEFNPANSNLRGTVAMALPGNNINGATSQWFVNVADNTFLDSASFTVFGRVIGEGMAVVDAIHAVPTFNISGALRNSALSEVPLLGYTPFTVALTGTVAVTTGSRAVTGTGTLFTQELIAGAAIRIDGIAYAVSSITSNTQLTLTTNSLTGGSSKTAFTNASPQDDHYLTLASIGAIGLP